MKKAKSKAKRDGDILLEYNFAGKKGLRGKYYHAYRQGHTVKVYDDKGNVSIRYFTLADGAVMLEPDVREYFPDSESVNKALRSLIALVPATKRHGRNVSKAR